MVGMNVDLYVRASKDMASKKILQHIDHSMNGRDALCIDVCQRVECACVF